MGKRRRPLPEYSRDRRGGERDTGALQRSVVRPGDAILVNGDVGRRQASPSWRCVKGCRSRQRSKVIRHRSRESFSISGGRHPGALSSGCHPWWSGERLGGNGPSAQRDIAIVESQVPVREDVRGACEILGLDPLYVADEGCFVAFVAPEDSARAHSTSYAGLSREDRVLAHLGEVGTGSSGWSPPQGAIGVSRILDQLSGEQLPRIC